MFQSGAKNVVLHGVLVCNSYSWTIHPTYSENVDILNIRIRNSSTSPNTDGIDPESCKNVNIIGNHVHVGDDCIALKSGKLFLGMKLHVPCENVIIRNCCQNPGYTVGIPSLGSQDTIAPAVSKGNETLLNAINDEIKALGKENFFHADYEATLVDTYGTDYEDSLVVEGGKTSAQ